MNNKYNESNSFGDKDLDTVYQGREIALNLLRIANELAEQNRLKILELKYKICGVVISEKELELEDKK